MSVAGSDGVRSTEISLPSPSIIRSPEKTNAQVGARSRNGPGLVRKPGSQTSSSWIRVKYGAEPGLDQPCPVRGRTELRPVAR